MATLQSRLSDLISAIGPDVKRALPFYITASRPGNLALFTGPRIYFPDNVDLVAVAFSVTTAPTGQSAIFEVLKNGSGTFSSDPAIAASGFTSSAGTLAGTTSFTARTDYLQLSCSQIGSSVPGADLTVCLKMMLT